MKLLSEHEKISKIKRNIIHILFLIYVGVVLRITVFRSGFSLRNFLQGGSISLSLFVGYVPILLSGSLRMFCYLFLGNILWFVPFGIYLEVTGKVRRLWQAAAIGFFFSLSIETLQYLFATGYSEVDDLVLNTLGVLIGAAGMRRIKKARDAG